MSLADRHPNLALLITTIAVLDLLLGLNFLFLNPTFLIWHAPNWIWGSTFLILGTGKLFSLYVLNNQWAVKVFVLLNILYASCLAAGTSEPFLDGAGSLQLPIFYLGLAVIQVPTLVEPFLNPATAKNGDT